jgi:hypothetical protein
MEARPRRNLFRIRRVNFVTAAARSTPFREEIDMKGILGWLIGIPIPIIILLYVFDVF